MPKKTDKKKTKVTNKKTKKTNIKTKPKTKSAIVKPPTIVIHTERLPKTKCCTEVSKTGEGYTIPFGYKDLKGTEPILPVTKKTAETEPTPVTKKPIVKATIETQTEPLAVNKKPIVKATIQTQTEPLAVVKKKTTKKKIEPPQNIQKQTDIRKFTTESAQIEPPQNIRFTIDEPPTVIETEPPVDYTEIQSEVQPEKNPKRKYDTSNKDLNKRKLLDKLFKLLLLSESPENAFKLTESYSESSNNQIKKRIQEEQNKKNP